MGQHNSILDGIIVLTDLKYVGKTAMVFTGYLITFDIISFVSISFDDESWYEYSMCIIIYLIFLSESIFGYFLDPKISSAKP